MICPVCGHENLQGVDACENCGTDLRTADIPQPGTRFEHQLVAEHLADLSHESRVATAGPDTSVRDAIRLLADGAECVLVIDDDRLIGIFTVRDALRRVAGRPADGIALADVMTPDPVVLRGADSVAVALHKMALGGFRHIPIVDGERPTGVVTAQDLFRHIHEILA